MIIQGLQISTRKEVAIKIINKEDKTRVELDQIREHIQMYKVARHMNVI